MNQVLLRFFVLLTTGLIVACGDQAAQDKATTSMDVTEEKPYQVLDESLRQLKNDFNVHKDKIRLLFIVGDTCGVCLRGMADLNDAFVSKAQNDERLVTFVVHVPTLGAKEKHVPDAIPLLDGPRVFHYWDGTGISGRILEETLQTDGIYAWDVWLAYGAHTEWLETAPPAPEFWMHQLGPLDRDLKLDADLFAQQTLVLMNNIEPGGFAASHDDEDTLHADGTVVPSVAQPMGVAVSQHIRGAGGYQNLKSIRSIKQTGTITWGTKSTTLEITQDIEDGLSRSYGDTATPLPDVIEKALAESWELNGLLFEWGSKGHQARKDGMLKIGRSLAWKILIRQENGMRWSLFIDSHSGDMVLATHKNEDGEPMFSIRASYFRDVDGFRVPFRVQYLDGNKKVIATEEFEDIGIVAEKMKL